jgi:hypothetical protein
MKIGSPYFIMLGSFLALCITILFYKIKIVLRDNGYKITFWYGHLFDVILIFRFSLSSKRYVYLWLLLLLLILIFIGMVSIMVMMTKV